MERHVVGVRSAYVAIQLEFELPINHHFIVKKNANFDTSLNMSSWVSHKMAMDLCSFTRFCVQKLSFK